MQHPWLMGLLVAAAGAGCVEATSTQTAAVAASCDTWTVDDPIMLWPPDHAMHELSLDDCVTITPAACPPPPTGVCGDGVVEAPEQCDDGNDHPFDGCDGCVLVDITPDRSLPGTAAAAGLAITSITSDEPDDGAGDGSTTGDTVVIDATTFQLRAERAAPENGRTYRVAFVDANGAAGACTFYVPHDLAVQ